MKIGAATKSPLPFGEGLGEGGGEDSHLLSDKGLRFSARRKKDFSKGYHGAIITTISVWIF